MAVDDEALITCTQTEPTKGGWVTVAFIIGAKLAVGVAAYGLSSNLTVYLIQQFNIPSIRATQISSIIGGSSALAPVIGAVVADAGPGCFNVISGASLFSFLGMLLFMMISMVPSLRPPPCSPEMCQGPAIWQLAVLFTATALILAGMGGTRFIAATFCASQLDSTSEKATFFNSYSMALYGTGVIGLTVVVYVQAELSWTWGFTLCAVLSALGLAVFLSRTRYYRHPKPQRNPVLAMLFALVHTGGSKKMESSPTTSSSDLTITHTEGEEITEDDFMPLIRFIPLMSSSILLFISVSMAASLTILQALVMDCEFGPNFTVPASTMPVFNFLSSILFIPLLTRVVFPIWQPTPLQRIGLGHLATIIALVTAALIESRRCKVLAGSTKPMPVLWLVPGLVLVGLGEALHFPGHLAFYYQELPDSLSNLATGVIALVSAIAFYSTMAVIALVRRITPWLQDDTNRSRLDNVYWMLAVVGTLNLGYFLICAKLYKRKEVEV